MSITLTPDMLAMLDSKIKEAIQVVASGATIVSKPKRVLTPEHLAAMKAGREKKAAEKAAEKAAGKVSTEAASDSGSASKKRGAKKLEDMTPEERATHDAKIAARKAARDAMTPEQKAEAKLKAEAKKAKKDSLQILPPIPEVTVPEVTVPEVAEATVPEVPKVPTATIKIKKVVKKAD